MRRVAVPVYKFSELSRAAKDRVKYDWEINTGYSWQDEAFGSLEKLAKVFDGKLKTWEIDWSCAINSSARFEMPKMSKAEIGRRLRGLGSYDKRTGKGHGDCVLTGYTVDEEVIDGFRLAFRQGETDLGKLMEAAFHSLMEYTESDYEDALKDDNFGEMCEANEWEFYADGTRFHQKKLN